MYLSFALIAWLAPSRGFSGTISHCTVLFKDPTYEDFDGSRVKMSFTSYYYNDYNYVDPPRNTISVPRDYIYASYDKYGPFFYDVEFQEDVEEDFSGGYAYGYFAGYLQPRDTRLVAIQVGVDFAVHFDSCGLSELRISGIRDGGETPPGDRNCYTVRHSCDGSSAISGDLFIEVECDTDYAGNPVRMNYRVTGASISKDCMQ